MGEWRYSFRHSLLRYWSWVVIFTPCVHLTAGKRPPVTTEQKAGWGPRWGPNVLEKGKLYCPCQDSKDSSYLSPELSQCTKATSVESLKNFPRQPTIHLRLEANLNSVRISAKVAPCRPLPRVILSRRFSNQILCLFLFILYYIVLLLLLLLLLWKIKLWYVT